ncbi:LOW QUALITY PROTEIN: hypothetical protein RJ639_007662 [Escallonia herrerae]|uniref:Uncharacterized protein n=1 Tax=Escallonia herrerae TaxID=1293975 RepID=A0AA88VZW0_9ASTE|nr:LOW QUALITY PROTEIN: hypothetical protein RJ639_007662 [Escallonia herrerae]
MMSPKQIPEDRSSSHGATSRRERERQKETIVANSLANNSFYRQLLENMVYLLHVPLLVSDRSFCCTFYLYVPRTIIYLVFNFAKALEGEATFKYTGKMQVFIPWQKSVLSAEIQLFNDLDWLKSHCLTVPSIINGGITALYFIMWGKGLKSCGPVRPFKRSDVLGLSVADSIGAVVDFNFQYNFRAILAEYSGAVLGVLSAVLYGRRGHVWKKVALLFAQCFSDTSIPGDKLNLKIPFDDNLDTEVQTEEISGMSAMVVPVFAGILSALRRVIARRVSLKNQIKRRLHAITLASATCFLFPVAMWDMIIGSTSIALPFSAWAFSSTILFGVILIFYVDSIAEERLHMVFSSPRHLMVAAGCIVVMEYSYKMDFSLAGFLICSAILGVGIYEATLLERNRKDPLQSSDLSNGIFEDQMHILLVSGNAMAEPGLSDKGENLQKDDDEPV